MKLFIAILILASSNLSAQTTGLWSDLGSTNEDKASTVPVLVTDHKDSGKDEFSFYIAPYLSIGGLFTNSIQLNNYPFFGGELRLGYKVYDRLYSLFSVDTGFNVRDASYPLITTITVGPEYFIFDSLSVFATLGLGILTAEYRDYTDGTVDTRAGFTWKIGVDWKAYRWGENKEYAIPMSLSYVGTKTRWLTCHAVMFSIGFMFFN